MPRPPHEIAITLWLLGASVGVLMILGSVFGLYGMAAAGLLLIPLARRESGAWAIGGALTLFGAVWLFLIWSESNGGGYVDDAEFWTVVGFVPLVIGLAATSYLARAGLRRSVAS